MNYRDFFKNKKATAKDILSLIPEGVSMDQFRKGIAHEKEHTKDEFVAAKIASDHLKDPKYYEKLDAAGLEEEKFEDAMDGSDYKDDFDDNGGLPKVGGALAVPHLGDPIHMAKIIQVGPIGGGPADGEVSGMTACCGGRGKGVAKDQGGVKVDSAGDKEPLTAGGKNVDSSIATKSVGGAVTPGEGQKQGGPNSQGTIADTAKLTESKNKVRKIVKEVLKEIQFDKQTGKWVRIDEAGHKAGCKCGFCANKGKFGKKADKEDKKEKKFITADGDAVPESKIGKKDKKDKKEVDENTVDMKMGKSYKTIQPRMYDIQSDDRARTNQYEPEITEMYDEEETCKMDERYAALATADRNLTEAELAELKTLGEKIDRVGIAGRNFGLSQGGVEPNIYENDEDDYERAKWQRGISRYNRQDKQRFECPTCKTPNALSAWEKKQGYQCNSCANAEEGPMGSDVSGLDEGKCSMCGADLKKDGMSDICTKCAGGYDKSKPSDTHDTDVPTSGDYSDIPENTVNMKMGSSYKTVQPRMYKTAEDDFARTNQYDPQVSEAGGQAVQHSSYRVQGKPDHGNLPQDPKTRWADDLDESKKKPSKVAKTISKGMKTKKGAFQQHLKHKTPKKTTSGVHKRKT